MCKKWNLRYDFFLEIFKYRELGMRPSEIIKKIDVPEYIVEKISYDSNYFKPVFDLIRREIAENKQSMDSGQFTIVDIEKRKRELEKSNGPMNRGYPHQTPFYPPMPPIYLSTPEKLESIRQTQNFNLKYGNVYGIIPLPPVKYAEGVTPYNLHEMEEMEGENGIVYSSIPGSKCVTPFDFDNCEEASSSNSEE
jgi:hypothetical protein